MNPLYLIDIAGLLLFLMYAVHQTASALRLRPRPPVAEQGVGLTFLIPAMNEEAVIAATLQNLRSTVPEARVVVIDDASADATAAIVEQYSQTDPMIALLRRVAPEAQENKGRALNWAVARLLQVPWLAGQDLSQQVFVILDADGRVNSDFAPQVRGAFQNPNVMAAQGWMRFRPVEVTEGGVRGLISRMLIFQQDLETFIVGHIQRLRASGGVASLTGNGQCMRVSYLSHQLGQGNTPWPDVLLEDFGSVMEIVLDSPRHKVSLLPAHIMQQGILDPQAFIKQRARWTQGALQCLPYLTRLWKSGASLITRLDFTYFILSPWLNIVLIVSIASQLLRRVFGWQGLLLPDWAGLLLTVIPLIIQLNWALRFRNEKGLSWWSLPYALISLPVYGAALLCSLPLAYSNYVRRQNTWFKGTRYVEQEPAHLPHVSIKPHQAAPHPSEQPQRSLSSGD
ncbi:MAG: glycosyl transferase [Deinococcus sp.]|nr:glycosyl transferase [Deinococcus sp.]